MTKNAEEICCKRTGGCLCGGVRFTILSDAPREKTLRPLIACHCKQCQKTSGSFVVATKVALKHLTFQAEETLGWYRSSEWAERGFCSRCGSSLFYRRRDPKNDSCSIMLGALDEANDLPFVGHIFTEGAHPMLARLSTTPQSKDWVEQPLIEAMHEQGWHDTQSMQNNPPPNPHRNDPP